MPSQRTGRHSTRQFPSQGRAAAALPAGFAAATQVLGTDRQTSERQIAIIGQPGNIAVTVWLQGREKYWSG